MLCEYEGEGIQTHVLELGGGKAGDPAFEETVERLASIAIAALRQEGMSIGLTVDDEIVVQPGSGTQQEVRILE